MKAPGEEVNRSELNHIIADCRMPIADFFCSNWQLEIGNVLGGLTKNQSIEVGIVAQWVQVVIVLCTHAQIGLKVKCFL